MEISFDFPGRENRRYRGPSLQDASLLCGGNISFLLRLKAGSAGEAHRPFFLRCLEKALSLIDGVTLYRQAEGYELTIWRDVLEKGLDLEAVASSVEKEFLRLTPAMRISVSIAVNDPRFVFRPPSVPVRSMGEERIAAEEILYSCRICQSAAAEHFCIIGPLRPGACGFFSYDEASLQREFQPRGPFEAFEAGRCLDEERGEWEGVNREARRCSGDAVRRIQLYAADRCPPPLSPYARCLAFYLPEAEGFVVLDRLYRGETPLGLTFGQALEMAVPGRSVPGVVSLSPALLRSSGFLRYHGGLSAVRWMPSCTAAELEGISGGCCGEREARSLEQLLQRSGPLERIRGFSELKGDPDSVCPAGETCYNKLL